MKVLLTADTVGGVWTYALELAEALAPHGVEFVLATLGAPLSAAQRAELARLSNVTCHESSYRLEWMADPWDDQVLAGEWLLEVAAREAPDLVHLNGYVHATLPWGLPVLVVAHSCVLTWWRAVKGEAAPSSWARYREVVRGGLSAADLVVAPTAALLEALRGEYGPIPGARVLPNGVGTGRFRSGEKEPFVLGAGRIWDEAKNLAALAMVAPRLPWPVYLAGDTGEPGVGVVVPNEGGVAESASSSEGVVAPATGRVNYLGRLPGSELRGWLARAAVYALPARYEPFGLSALEAGLSGCALVLGDIPTLREVWGEAALFVPPGDGSALHTALQGVLGDDAARAVWGARARARASSFTAERMAAGYLAIYEELSGLRVAGEARSGGVEVSCAS